MIASPSHAGPRRASARSGTPRLRSCLAIALSLGLGACHSSAPILSQEQYKGPPVEVTERGKFYLIRFQAPSPGWMVTLDEVRPSLGAATLLVTAREPDPSYMQAQVIVSQDVLTTVEATTPITVYGRVSPFVTSSKSRTYQFVGRFGPPEASTGAGAKPMP